MIIKIRAATQADFPAILSMIKELAAFEHEEDNVTNTVEQMKKEQKHFCALVAENDKKELIGFAVYFYAYYTFVGKSIYLDDIYIKEAYRGQKVGSKLLDKFLEIARKENCKRARWQVLNWNEKAIKMYEKYGCTIDKKWYNCDLTKKQLDNLK